MLASPDFVLDSLLEARLASEGALAELLADALVIGGPEPSPPVEDPSGGKYLNGIPQGRSLRQGLLLQRPRAKTEVPNSATLPPNPPSTAPSYSIRTSRAMRRAPYSAAPALTLRTPVPPAVIGTEVCVPLTPALSSHELTSPDLGAPPSPPPRKRQRTKKQPQGEQPLKSTYG